MNEMSHWLFRQVQLQGHEDAGRTRLSLVGAWPMLRIGDRVVNVSGAGVNATGEAEAITDIAARVTSIQCGWSDGDERDGRNAGNRGKHLPKSEVDLVF